MPYSYLVVTSGWMSETHSYTHNTKVRTEFENDVAAKLASGYVTTGGVAHVVDPGAVAMGYRLMQAVEKSS